MKEGRNKNAGEDKQNESIGRPASYFTASGVYAYALLQPDNI